MYRLEFDKHKDLANRAKHGIALARAVDFEWDTARVEPDARRDYGEPRYKATGLLDGRLHVLVFTPRRAALRLIGLRKANMRERRRYGQETQAGPH